MTTITGIAPDIIKIPVGTQGNVYITISNLHLQFTLNSFYQISTIYADTIDRPVDIKDLVDNGFITDLTVDAINPNTLANTAIYTFIDDTTGNIFEYAANSFSATYPNTLRANLRVNNAFLPYNGNLDLIMSENPESSPFDVDFSIWSGLQATISRSKSSTNLYSLNIG
jgi:hypothetical protein